MVCEETHGQNEWFVRKPGSPAKVNKLRKFFNVLSLALSKRGTISGLNLFILACPLRGQTGIMNGVGREGTDHGLAQIVWSVRAQTTE